MSWDKTLPDGDLAIAVGDDAIRANFSYIAEATGIAESNSGKSLDMFAGSGHTGYLLPRAGTLVDRDAGLSPPEATGMIYIATDQIPMMLSRWNGSSWDYISDFGPLGLGRTGAATEAERTMVGRIVLSAIDTIISGLDTDTHRFWVDDAKTDQIMELVQGAAAPGDWDLFINIGSSLKQVLCIDTELVVGDAGKVIVVNAAGTACEALPGTSVFVPSYDSGLKSITEDSYTSYPHGMTGLPVLVHAVLECVAIDAQWAVGDQIVLGYGMPFGSSEGIIIAWDATNMSILVGSDGATILRKSDHDSIGILVAKWKVRVRAWV